MAKWRILGFDIENRQGAYNGDYPPAWITAIAACWHGQPNSLRYWQIKRGAGSALEEFLQMYKQANVVTGHYIRKHDLPIMNGVLAKLHRSTLEPKMTIDTKLDWVKKKDVSAKLEDMLEYYGIPHKKVHISTAVWERINAGYPDALEILQERCVGDVVAQLALREKLAELGHLTEPKVWQP